MREHDAQGLDCRTQHQPHTQCATKPLHRLQWCRQLRVFIFLGSRNDIPSSLYLPAVADGRERKREANQEQYSKHNRAGRLPGLAGDTEPDELAAGGTEPPPPDELAPGGKEPEEDEAELP